MVWVQNASPEVDAASNYPTIIAVCVSITVLMMVTVSTRIYVRAAMIKMMGMDDWIILFSAICSIVYSGLCIGQSRWGLGLPVTLRPPVNLNQYSVINFAGRPFYMFGILGFKIALCLAYLRILSYSQRVYRFVIWCVVVLCTMGHIAGTLVLLFQCKPVQKSWLPATIGVCLPNVPTFFGLALITICFDVIIFFLPIPFLWKLNINNRRRGALIGMFLVGLFTTVCSILRMLRIFPLAVDGNSTLLVLWGTIELNVGVALTCIPALAPLFTYFRDHKSTKEYNKYQNNSHELRSVETPSNKCAECKARAEVSTKSVSAGDDAESQTFILSPQTSFENQTHSRPEIQKTVEISVDTERNCEPLSLQQITHSKQKSEWLTRKY